MRAAEALSRQSPKNSYTGVETSLNEPERYLLVTAALIFADAMEPNILCIYQCTYKPPMPVSTNEPCRPECPTPILHIAASGAMRHYVIKTIRDTVTRDALWICLLRTWLTYKLLLFCLAMWFVHG